MRLHHHRLSARGNSNTCQLLRDLMINRCWQFANLQFYSPVQGEENFYPKCTRYVGLQVVVGYIRSVWALRTILKYRIQLVTDDSAKMHWNDVDLFCNPTPHPNPSPMWNEIKWNLKISLMVLCVVHDRFLGQLMFSEDIQFLKPIRIGVSADVF